MSEQFKIKHAAIIKDSIIYIGHRHHDCIRVMAECGVSAKNCIQGFVTNYGGFVTREYALEIATNANQIIKKHRPLDKLMSEDIY
jgi:hypothetical protein